jgi:2'-5' RNA ligase
MITFPLQRTFLALPLEGEAIRQFQKLQEPLKKHEDCLRFQNPETPHITLHYWSELMEIEFVPIQMQAERIAVSHVLFSIHVTHAETFGSRGEDRVLVLTLGFSEELARLKKSCPWPDPRKFSPHITLARIHHPQRFTVHKKKIMKKLEGCAFEIPCDRLRLYGEVEGVRQTPLQDFVLGD